MNTTLKNDPLAATKKYLVAQFTKCDLMMYALGIGCGSECSVLMMMMSMIVNYVMYTRKILKYFHHCSYLHSHLSLKGSINTWMMEYNARRLHILHLVYGLFPRNLWCTILRMELNVDYSQQDIDIRRIQRLPILHVSQSLILHDEIKLFTDDYFNSLDPPTQVWLETKIVSVEPQNKGTLVTSETTYY
jgi:hypothetical protein